MQKKREELEGEYQKIRKNTQTELLNKELYDKRFNFLIHGLFEDSTTAWETKSTTQKIFKEFLIEGLKIENEEDIKYVDVHRLPQDPVYSESGIKRNRPVIVKLSDSFSKEKFCSSFKNLKNFNNARKTEKASKPYVFITNHLPKELQHQRRLLMPAFKKAKEENKKCQWKIINAESCLFIDGIKYNM